MSQPVTVIDYGMGNLLSVCRALEHIGADVTLSSDPNVIQQARRLILPGVGAFGDGMKELQQRSLIEPIQQCAAQGTPLLGICLGAQMLLESSEEFGQHQGLGLIPGEVHAIPTSDSEDKPLKVPHVGWADLHHDGEHPLLQAVPDGSAVYFVHSYQCHPRKPHDLIAHCELGGHRLTAMVGNDHIMGCQFHPEKSGPVGLHILHNFLESGS
jgi:glutamine amidotransferase